MNNEPPLVIGQLSPEEDKARMAQKNAEFEMLRAKYRKSGDNTTLIAFQSAAKASRTEWAQNTMRDIAQSATNQLLAYKDGSVEISVDGENLRVKVRKIPKHDEYQVWIAEPSLLALDRLLIARREQYRQNNTLDGETYTSDTSSALNPEMMQRVDGYPTNISAFTTNNSPKQVYAQTAPAFPKPKLARTPMQPKKKEIFYERDVMRDDLNRALTAKMKNPANQGSEAFSSAADFTRVIDAALQDIALPHSDDENSPIHNCDKPFGLEQMQLFREIIKSRINGSPRASAGLTVLIHAIDEVMEQYWDVRPLNFRPTSDASRGK